MSKWLDGSIKYPEYSMDALADLPLVALRNIHLLDGDNIHILSMQRMVNLRELNLDLHCEQEKLIEALRMFSELPELVELV